MNRARRTSGDYGEVDVLLFHKPRGCKGVWQRIEQSDALRVTKGKGKWLKLEVRSRYDFSVNDLEVYLVDATSATEIAAGALQHAGDEGFVIENTSTSTTTSGQVVEMEIKLDRVCKRLQFFATIVADTLDGTRSTFTGRSIEFSAHNNGKAR